MSNEYGFFAAKNHDRKYSADDFCALFGDFFSDGVLGKDTNSFKVTSKGDMTLEVSGGTAYVQGRWYRRNSSQEVTVSGSDGSFGRYDAVVIRCDFKERMIYVSVVKGIPSEEPEKYEPVRNENIYEIIIAYVYVEANTVNIMQEDITDTRGDGKVCGFVTNAIENVDTSGLFAQYDAEWDLLRNACAKDADGVIAAWKDLNTVKTVNGQSPEKGNVTVVQGNIPDGDGAYQMPYRIERGKFTATAMLNSITFEMPFGAVPVVFAQGVNLTESSTTAGTVQTGCTSVTEAGFTMNTSIGRNGVSPTSSAPCTVEWIAFGS